MTAVISKKIDKNSAQISDRLAEKILALADEQIINKTHFFEGRYENIYVDIETISELKQVIQQAKKFAAEILDRNINDLKIGFWINIMQRGHTTSLHCHEDADELLSGVFYVKVPGQSGQFIYHLDGEKHSLVPEQGSYLFFSPALLHEVTEHQSDEPRISVAFNIGPMDPEED